MINTQAESIRRLNVLLKLPQIDLALLNNGDFETLLDNLYWAILGRKERKREKDVFHAAAQRPGIKEAQETLRGHLASLRYGTGKEVVELELAKQTLLIVADDKGFAHSYISRDFPTMVYGMLSFLLERAQVKRSDLLTCANEKCRTVFVPLRSRASSDRAFCSPKCANLIAAKEYRKRRAGELKVKERKRSKARYRRKVLKK